MTVCLFVSTTISLALDTASIEELDIDTTAWVDVMLKFRIVAQKLFGELCLMHSKHCANMFVYIVCFSCLNLHCNTTF